MSLAPSIKSALANFMAQQGIPGEMEQNLIKEAIHLHLLSALSDAGVLGHVVFQGGTALRLCYGGERYSEDLDFVCGKAGAYVDEIQLDRLVALALETTKSSTATAFLDEMSRFLPAQRIKEIREARLHHVILAASSELIKRAVLSTTC